MTDIITTQGKNLILNRAYKATPDYASPTVFKVGANNGTPVVADQDLDYAVPILDGTINDDGSNTLTGSSGGSNSTDNTDTFKPGGNVSDATAQNLIAGTSSAIKIWTIANLATAGFNIEDSKYCGFWIYIKDSTASAKFLTSGTALEMKLGSDASNYYSLSFTASDLSTGWNWLSSADIISDWTETGTVTGNIDTFIIEITTNNASDAFATGDVVYDLLRTWVVNDTIANIVVGSPTFSEVNNTVTVNCYLKSVDANGFVLNALGLFNEDAIPIMSDVSTYTAESKANTDEISFVLVNELS